MINNIFIGVDGGATRCSVRIEDEAGNLLSQAISGPASIRLSVENSWNSILSALNIALKQANLNLQDKNKKFHLGLGLAGCELPSACKKFLDQVPPYFVDICLRSDAYTACLGAHAGKDGAIIIVGTGVSSLQIQNGKTVQIGGWGFPHGDEGGGAWLGLEAVRLTLQWLDGRFDKRPSRLFDLIFERFDNDLTKLVVWANNANSNEFAKIAPLVIKQIEQKDYVAIMLIKRAAQEIDKIGKVLAKYTEGNAKLPCALFGSVAPFIKPWLDEKLKVRLVPVRYDATIGAILMLNKNRKI